jgi:hypothetical protein
VQSKINAFKAIAAIHACAILSGCKLKANPGRDGSPRVKIIYKGIVFITDETETHEITSWRIVS